MSSFITYIEARPVLKKRILPVTAIICALFWGSAFPAIKHAYLYFDPSSLQNRLAFAGIRFTLAGALVLLFVPNLRQHFQGAPKKLLFAIAFTQTVAQYICFYWGLSLISGVLTAILVSTSSFWWVLLAPLVNRSDKINRGQLLALIFGFLGVCVCVYRPGSENASVLWGGLLILGCSLSGALASIMVKPLAKSMPTSFMTGFALCFGGLILLLTSPFQAVTLMRQAPPVLYLLTLHLIFISAIAFSLWYLLVNLYDVPTLSGYRFLIPVCGALESAAFVPGESLTPEMAVGGVMVLLSVRLLEKLR